MNRFLQYFNFVGILALAALCCVQWRTNRQANLQIIELEKIRLDQTAKIADQDKTIKGYVADLDDLRQRLTLSEAALKDAEDKFKMLATERDKLVVERDQLKASLGKWMAAVAARDAALKQVNDQIKTATDDRNSAVSKFNDLASKYNALVKDLEAAEKKK